MDDVIGLAGPITTSALMGHLRLTAEPPMGLGGAPVTALALELLARGRRLAIFSLDPAVEHEVMLEGERLTLWFGPYRPKRARDFFRVERAAMSAAIQRVRPSVVHAHWTYEFALAAQASGVPALVTAHDAPWRVLGLDFRPYRVARTVMAHQAVHGTRAMVAVSPYVATHLTRWMRYRREIAVIPNGLPEAAFRTSRPQGDRPFTFVTAANGFNKLKNTAAVLVAFARVRSELPAAQLHMFGAEHGPSEAAAHWAVEQGLAAGVTFAGAMPQPALLAHLESASDVFVHPSLEESHGMALIEAMAAGLPVIGGATSGAVPWTLDAGAAGLLVDVRRVDALAEAMLRLAGSADVRRALGLAGQASARRRFHIGAVADAYEACYESLRRSPGE